MPSQTVTKYEAEKHMNEQLREARKHEVQMMDEYVQISMRPACKTADELIAAIERYLDVHYKYEMRGFTLMHMNRKFGMAARKLGLNAGTVLSKMNVDNRLFLKRHDNKHNVVISRAFGEQLDRSSKANTGQEIQFQIEMIRGIMEKSLL